MADDPDERSTARHESEEIHTEISTDAVYDTEEESRTLAVQTVQQGERRIDWRVGFKDGSFAEATDLYDAGELLFSPDELTPITEWPSGKLNDENEFFPLEGMDVDDDGNTTNVYGPPQDGVELALRIIEDDVTPETILNEWWEDLKRQYDTGTL